MRFSSKILLFGEYGLVAGGQGFAMPFPKFEGCFTFDTSAHSSPSNRSLLSLYEYLKKNKVDFSFLNLQEFEKDLRTGIWFDSGVPTGYGLGSSGALVAALYQKYKEDDDDDFSVIQNQLALIESYFHGSSSGVDPLVSLLKQAVVINKENVILLPDWNIDKLECSVFLVDTGIASNTQHLVEWFKGQQAKSNFKFRTETDFLARNEKVVSAVQQEDPINFEDVLTISKYQIDCLDPMIPSTFRKHFYSGLENGDFAFKLCGSGGGGYMLCFDRKGVAQDYFEQEKLQYIRV